jgi:hypothetical protein
MKTTSNFLKLFWLIFIFNCSSDSVVNNTDDTPLPIVLTEEVEVYEEDLVNNDLVLAIENGATTAYLLDKKGYKKFTWNFDSNLGNDLELLPDGRVLGIFKTENPIITFGGFGGVIKIINPDGSLDWEFEYSSTNFIAHHDVEMLPNGNVLFVSWERIDLATAQQFGASATEDIFVEKLVEVNTQTNSIVWEWHSWDHIIQDLNNSLDNYGIISNFPERININYGLPEKTDIMHINGIDYDADKDVIYMSVNHYNEIWVVDHSTTAQEAASSNGGNFNKGGDLLYRFGNPSAYNNSEGTQIFHNVHFPNLIENNTSGNQNMLVYSNGADVEQSSAIEFELPQVFSLLPNTNNEPIIIWDFTNTEMYSPIVGSSVRLSNGNTLIAESNYGFWEVTPNGDIAWKYNGTGNSHFWRGYAYDLDYPALQILGISF